MKVLISLSVDQLFYMMLTILLTLIVGYNVFVVFHYLFLHALISGELPVLYFELTFVID